MKKILLICLFSTMIQASEKKTVLKKITETLFEVANDMWKQSRSIENESEEIYTTADFLSDISDTANYTGKKIIQTIFLCLDSEYDPLKMRDYYLFRESIED